MVADNVCMYFKYGYCRYQEKCRLQHIKEVCQDKLCEKRCCPKRHPRICRYHLEFNFCKFGSFCLYLHPIKGSMPCENSSALAEKIAALEELVFKLKEENIEIREKLVDAEKKNSIPHLSNIEGKVTNLEINLTGVDAMVKTYGNQIEDLKKMTDLHKIQLKVSDDEAYLYSKAVDELEEKVAAIEDTLTKSQCNFAFQNNTESF